MGYVRLGQKSIRLDRIGKVMQGMGRDMIGWDRIGRNKIGSP